MEQIISTNPALGYALLGKIAISTEKEIAEKVALANKAKDEWKELGVLKRIELLSPLYGIIKSKEKELAELISNEVGKAIKDSEYEVTGALGKVQWFLENAPKGVIYFVSTWSPRDFKSMVVPFFKKEGYVFKQLERNIERQMEHSGKATDYYAEFGEVQWEYEFHLK